MSLPTLLSSSFSVNKSTFLSQQKQVMTANLSSSFTSPKLISTIIIKDKSNISTQPLTDSAVYSSNEKFSPLNEGLQTNGSLITILLHYIETLNSEWEKKYLQIQEKNRKTFDDLNKKIKCLVHQNTILKNSILKLIDNASKTRNDKIEEEKKKIKLMNQLIKENEFLRKITHSSYISPNDIDKMDSLLKIESTPLKQRSRNGSIKKRRYKDKNDYQQNSHSETIICFSIEDNSISESSNSIEFKK